MALIISCQNSKKFNSVLLIKNSMLDSAVALIIVEQNGEILYEGYLERSTHADDYYLYKVCLSPDSNQLKVRLPQHQHQQEFNFTMDSTALVFINTHYLPMNEKTDTPETVKIYQSPKVVFYKVDRVDITKYSPTDLRLLGEHYCLD